MKPTPTQRSREHYLAKYGDGTVHVAEYFHTRAKRRFDFFGFADLVVLDGQPGSLAVQSTTSDNASKRVDKILKSPQALKWALAGNRITVHGWRKMAKTPGIWHANAWSIYYNPITQGLTAIRTDKPTTP